MPEIESSSWTNFEPSERGNSIFGVSRPWIHLPKRSFLAVNV
ncbi:hypothetical protein ACPOL_2621 [Acidisarcina polymorpha]|uniref:Uncharacterized protein n=1 Tax=Acidisarcina polymorpha TaxID=2211140 RepID=A0A2Z5FZL1_9BACT|nr:hypothetical protein ACPOL_2621 [Acidisarcina polymorpha]